MDREVHATAGQKADATCSFSDRHREWSMKLIWLGQSYAFFCADFVSLWYVDIVLLDGVKSRSCLYSCDLPF